MAFRCFPPVAVASVCLLAGLAGCAAPSGPAAAVPQSAVAAVPALEIMGVSSNDTDTGVAPKTTLWGHDYIGLRGRPPYFVAIPSTRKILFVTPVTEQAGPTIVHLADFDTRSVVDIPAYRATGIGANIGADPVGLEPEKVVSATEHTIILEDVYAGGVCRFTIDLDAKTVVAAWRKPDPGR